MAKQQKRKGQIPYVIVPTPSIQNAHFYARYDASFLFNKAVTLLYVIGEGEPVVQQVEANLVAMGGGKLPERYVESLRTELFFTALHQCEMFFALLIALFQPLPHWVYLTTYETTDIKQAVKLIVMGNISEVTHGAIDNLRDFTKVTVYSETVVSDPETAARWDENIDNAMWLIERIGAFFLKYDRAYNSYKHGLRMMVGPHTVSLAPQNADGSLRGPMGIIQASEESVTYLQKEPIREVEGEKEIPISEVTKAFNPFEASFYIAKMSQMLETIRTTRLYRLTGGEEGFLLNTFFGLDRDEVLRLARYEEWTQTPMRADEARKYSETIERIRTSAKQAERLDSISAPDSPTDSNVG